ncbi:probable polygalacturonase At3g15720 [Rhodamnia argentea]|uniref:Probable polygalacturonase At3g15720 n=1 Tax=Rhodamnia argentea TaxID=178133 RepID=A0ABM3GYN7_9MYRT|nr:probable polygalacturonase At3g15720 [Rhodamnia argentea]
MLDEGNKRLMKASSSNGEYLEHFAVCLLLFVALSTATCEASTTSTSFDVLGYGAVGDGKTDDSSAFLEAWRATCESPSKLSILDVPAKKTFLLKPVTFSGPCQPDYVYVLFLNFTRPKVSGNIAASSSKTEYSGLPINSWLVFSNVDGLMVTGTGIIDGRGSGWWSQSCIGNASNDATCKGPTPTYFDFYDACANVVQALTFYRCKRLVLNGLRHVNSPRTHITLSSCKFATISNTHISAPATSPNTDGIDISDSTLVQVRDSFIGTGDDCIAVSGGSSHINVTRITCGPGHGISIGSLGAHGENDTVENVIVQNCTLKGTMTGVRIKTWQGGLGYARNISFNKIRFIRVDNPIIIDQYYCPTKVDCQNKTSGIRVSDISYSAIYGTSVTDKVINLSCDQNFGCSNIVLDHVYIKSTVPKTKAYPYCFNAHGRYSHTKPAVTCLLE